MDKDSNAMATCYCCGKCREKRAMRPFGHDKFGRTISWSCRSCSTPEQVNGKPHLSFATIAQAERLAAAGAGWNADQVMRRALDLLEARVVELA